HLFAEEGNENYGEHVWTLETELQPVPEAVILWAAEYYEIDRDEAAELVNPDDIVDSAGAWDDGQFVSDLWQAMEYSEIEEAAGYRTPDGAVVLNVEDVELVKTFEDDNDW
ncbi:MAG: hypothetical protein ACYTFK_13575, partial [Planctomycetota bacterium]